MFHAILKLMRFLVHLYIKFVTIYHTIRYYIVSIVRGIIYIWDEYHKTKGHIFEFFITINYFSNLFTLYLHNRRCKIYSPRLKSHEWLFKKGHIPCNSIKSNTFQEINRTIQTVAICRLGLNCKLILAWMRKSKL